MSKCEGAPCKRCGATLRYGSAAGRCVACRVNNGRDNYAKNRSVHDDLRVGLPHGFVRFDSLAHGILVCLHKYGAQSNASLSEALSERADAEREVAATLKRLVEHGFAFVVGKDRPEVGRSYRLYGLTNKRVINSVRKLAPKERNQRYRERLALKQSNSVFTFRGNIEL